MINKKHYKNGINVLKNGTNVSTTIDTIDYPCCRLHVKLKSKKNIGKYL